MRDSGSQRTLKPTKAGSIFGKFTPSLLGKVKVKTTDGKTKIIRANRRERRHGVRPD